MNQILKKGISLLLVVVMMWMTTSPLLAGTQSDKKEEKSVPGLSMPKIRGTLRGRYEYQTGPAMSRFELRNARLSADGTLPLRAFYKMEVDFCDEGNVKIKDMYAGLIPFKNFTVSIGEQRMPFTIDAHRTPQTYFFANRSFICKQTQGIRDVGIRMGYTLTAPFRMIVEGGVSNGSNYANEKTAWHKPGIFSFRLQMFPYDVWNLSASVQRAHTMSGNIYHTDYDLATYYEDERWHLEFEYLHKHYQQQAFDDIHAIDAFASYHTPIKRGFFQGISFRGRYDYMTDFSDGKSGFDEQNPTRLLLTDYERHRMTLGIVLHVRNPYFLTDLRLNYENYWYPHGGAKESEQTKLVAELLIRF